MALHSIKFDFYSCTVKMVYAASRTKSAHSLKPSGKKRERRGRVIKMHFLHKRFLSMQLWFTGAMCPTYLVSLDVWQPALSRTDTHWHTPSPIVVFFQYFFFYLFTTDPILCNALPSYVWVWACVCVSVWNENDEWISWMRPTTCSCVE